MRTKIKVIFSLIFIVGLISTSCVKDKFDEPAVDKPTAFNLMGRHERLSLKVGYYF